MTLSNFPTWAVDGPPPMEPVHGLLQAAAAPAAGVRFVIDSTVGPHDLNSIAPSDAGLEPGLFWQGNTLMIRQPDGTTNPVAVPDNAGRERWLGGIAVYPYPVDVPDVWDACDHTGSGTLSTSKNFGTPLTPPEFAAITISEPITCTTFQVPDEAAFKARAVAVLSATESYAVARELMSGAGVLAATGSPYLTDTHVTVLNGGAFTDPNHGLQIAERAIAATGRLGLVHCSPMMATALLGNGFVIKDKTGVIRTINGNVVIPDAGYVGVSAPSGHVDGSPNQEYIYVTGPVDIRRSEIFTTPDNRVEALDKGTVGGASNNRPNTFTYRAERYYAINWDTALHSAVPVDRCLTTCVTSS